MTNMLILIKQYQTIHLILFNMILMTKMLKMSNKIFQIILILLTIFLITTLIPLIIKKNSFFTFLLKTNVKTVLKSSPEMPNWNNYPIVPLNKMSRILIITEARSGSTFLGLYNL